MDHLHEGVSPLSLENLLSVFQHTLMITFFVLVVMMMKRIKFSSEEYAKRHHGGYLGNKSRMQAKIASPQPSPKGRE